MSQVEIGVDLDEYKDIFPESLIHHKVKPVVNHAMKVHFGLNAANDLYESLPTHVIYESLPEASTPGLTDAHDLLLVAGVLTSWKTLRLLRAASQAWPRPSRAHSFDAFLAASSVRSALEETARTYHALQMLDSRMNALAANNTPETRKRLTDLLENLSNNKEETGLEGSPSSPNPPGYRKLVGQLVEAAKLGPFSERDGQNLYSYLSSIVHPQGPGRSFARGEGAGQRQTRWLLRDPSQESLLSVRVACLAGASIAGLAVSSHWDHFVGLTDRVDAVGGFAHDRPSERLFVMLSDWRENLVGAAGMGSRNGVWTYWSA